MLNFQVSADSSCDMNIEYIQANNVACIPMVYAVSGIEYVDTLKDSDRLAFLDQMRAGAIASSTQVTREVYLEHWEKMYEQSTLPIVHTALSSGLSGTYLNGVAAREAFLARHPEAKIHVQDSMSATQGIGLQVHRMVKMRDEGCSFDEAAQWLTEKAPRLQSFYSVDDLVYLKRGGRISPTSAWVGTLLGIKPVMNIDKEGRLALLEKAKGRKRAIIRLGELIRDTIEEPQDQIIHISHADCEKDAQTLVDYLRENVNPAGFFISVMGSIITTHAGPGTLAVFCTGKLRE